MRQQTTFQTSKEYFGEASVKENDRTFFLFTSRHQMYIYREMDGEREMVEYSANVFFIIGDLVVAVAVCYYYGNGI